MTTYQRNKAKIKVLEDQKAQLINDIYAILYFREAIPGINAAARWKLFFKTKAELERALYTGVGTKNTFKSGAAIVGDNERPEIIISKTNNDAKGI